MIPIVHHAAYEFDIGPHVFPTRKYRLIRERLLADRTIARDDIHTPKPVSHTDMALVHTSSWIEKITTNTMTPMDEMLLEVPFSPGLREAMWLCTGGTLLAGALAFEHAVAMHLGGGFHHAFADHGEGFCLVNDVAVAIAMLRRDGLVSRAMVIDLDVHHGNGTAAVFAAEPAVFTFSMHQERNYPTVKPPSDLDIGLDDGVGDREYLDLLGDHLPRILRAHAPEIAYYLAGADPYREDQLGGLGLTIGGLKERDTVVFECARAAGVPIAVCLAGGYAINTDDTVEIHCNTVRAAREAYLRPTENMRRI